MTDKRNPDDFISEVERLVGDLEDLRDPISEIQNKWDIVVDALSSAYSDIVHATETQDD